jgi:3-oxoacyl-(acyl-carrier-protein) synthase
MNNNYAFGGNNCSMLISIKPCSIPLTTYDAKPVAITGIGAVTAIGHNINEILHHIDGDEVAVELGEISFLSILFRRLESY